MNIPVVLCTGDSLAAATAALGEIEKKRKRKRKSVVVKPSMPSTQAESSEAEDELPLARPIKHLHDLAASVVLFLLLVLPQKGLSGQVRTFLVLMGFLV